MRILLVLACCAVAVPSFATTLTFDDGRLAENNVLATQYADMGVTFAPGGYTGPAPDGFFNWATKTGMHVTSDPGNAGAGYSGTSGFILHTFDDYFSENGDPIMTLSFASPITSFSADFIGIIYAENSMVFAEDAMGNIVASTAASGSATTQTLSLAGLTGVSTIKLAVGAYDDWVGIDNVTFVEAVPEPTTMTVLGLGFVALIRRRMRQSH